MSDICVCGHHIEDHGTTNGEIIDLPCGCEGCDCKDFEEDFEDE